MSISKAEWEARFDATRMHLINDRGFTPLEAWKRARQITTRRHGPCPKEVKLPLTVRVFLWWLKKKLGQMAREEVGMGMIVKKLVVAALYGLGAAAPVLQLALADAVVTGNEWGGILSAFLVAFWGKFSSNTTVVAASRKGETLSGPR